METEVSQVLTSANYVDKPEQIIKRWVESDKVDYYGWEPMLDSEIVSSVTNGQVQAEFVNEATQGPEILSYQQL